MVDEDVRSVLKRSNYMTPEHFLLINAILTLPKTSLKKKYQRRIAAINTVTAYCDVKKGIFCRRGRFDRLIEGKILRIIEIEKSTLF
jgi:hypothetical protein